MAKISFCIVAVDEFQIGVHFRKQCLTTSRAHAREPCISAGICAGDKSNITVCLTPLDVEFIPDGAVDLRLGFASVQHPGDESAPLVNFTLTALAVKMTLAGADESAFGDFYL